MAAWVPRGVGRQQGRWSWRRSTDLGRLKAGSVAAKIGQLQKESEGDKKLSSAKRTLLKQLVLARTLGKMK
jgi:hypothetical protein